MTEPRCVSIGKYIRDNKATIRQAAAEFGLAKSTVHELLRKRLASADKALYEQVSEILETNFEERHIRGGIAVLTKYGAVGSALKKRKEGSDT